MLTEKELAEVIHYAEMFCSKKEVCKSDVKKKLSKYNLAEHEYEKIINHLEQENFINEQRYSIAFANDKFKFNKWGKQKIIFELSCRNIEKTIIFNAVSQLDTLEYNSKLEQELLKKKKSIKDTDKMILKSKLIRFALSRGFVYNECEKIINRIISEAE